MDNSINDSTVPLSNESSFPYRRYTFAFIGAVILIDLFEAVIYHYHGIPLFFSDSISFPSPSLNFLFGTIFCQVCLLSIWLGLGNIPVVFRCFLTLAVMETWCFVMPVLRDLFDHTYEDQARYWFCNLLPTTFSIAIVLWIGRLFGMRLFNIHAPASSAPAALGRFQFSILCLLEWITLAAIFMASLSYIFGYEKHFSLPSNWLQNVIFALGYTALSVSLTWAILSIRIGIAQIIVQIIGIYLSLRFLSCVFTYINTDLFDGAFAACLFTASIWFFRLIGYRLAWKCPAKCKP